MHDQFELRALEPIARCLIRRLMVPRIYYNATWPGFAEGAVDLLALDRDGVGDAHLVQVKHDAARALVLGGQLLNARAPYRWIAFFRGTEDEVTARAFESRSGLYIPGEPGRIGLIEVVEMAGDELGANVRLSAERFATPAYEMATAFSNTHEAQIQFGG